MRNAIIAPDRHGAPGGKSVVADVTPPAAGGIRALLQGFPLIKAPSTLSALRRIILQLPPRFPHLEESPSSSALRVFHLNSSQHGMSKNNFQASLHLRLRAHVQGRFIILSILRKNEYCYIVRKRGRARTGVLLYS